MFECFYRSFKGQIADDLPNLLLFVRGNEGKQVFLEDYILSVSDNTARTQD